MVSEILYYLEDVKNVDLPFKWYVLLNIFQALLLILMNIPFLRFLMKPVQKIVEALNRLADGKYDEKIDFESRKEQWSCSRYKMLLKKISKQN